MAKVLIIDDDSLLQTTLRARLEEASFSVVTAQTGLSGLRAAEDEQPQVIVVDLLMPDLDGIEVIRRLRQNPVTWEIPVVVLTAQGDAESRSQTHALGVRRFLRKPLSPKHLVAEVQRLVQGSLQG
jgi:DNA-binding response OmpR family regulator